jgi:hypothetical protein
MLHNLILCDYNVTFVLWSFGFFPLCCVFLFWLVSCGGSVFMYGSSVCVLLIGVHFLQCSELFRVVVLFLCMGVVFVCC